MYIYRLLKYMHAYVSVSVMSPPYQWTKSSQVKTEPRLGPSRAKPSAKRHLRKAKPSANSMVR